MIDDIIKLIDLSIENGTITDEEYKVIQMRALRSGVSEEEIKLIIEKRLKQHANISDAVVSPQVPVTPFAPTNNNTLIEPDLIGETTSTKRGSSLMRVFIGIGKYLLGVAIVTYGGMTIFTGIALIENTWFTILLILLAPIVMFLSRNFLRSIIYLTSACLILNFLMPILGLSYGKSYPTLMSVIEKRDAGRSHKKGFKSNNTVGKDGTYSANPSGAISTFIISGGSWYAEDREERTGEILGSSVGTLEGNDIIDEYGNTIGYVRNGRVRVNRDGIEVTLDRK